MPYSKLSFLNLYFKEISDELTLLQVRSGYVKNDFEWDNLKKLSFKVAFLQPHLLVVYYSNKLWLNF